MVLHALRESFLDARPLDLGREAAHPARGKPANHDAAAGPSQFFLVLIAAGLLALALLAPMILGYQPLRAETGAAFLVIAAISLLAALGASRSALAKAREAEEALAFQAAALQGAGAVALRWNLANGDLAWKGGAAGLLQIASGRLPANFRDLRPLLHPDDSVYALISQALRTSMRQVTWPIRIKDAEDGWRPFVLRGAIKAGGATGGAAFQGVLIPAEAPAEPQAQSLPVRLTRILESLPISFATWDSHNRLLFCNRKFRQLYGIGRMAGARRLLRGGCRRMRGRRLSSARRKCTGLPGASSFATSNLPMAPGCRSGSIGQGTGPLRSFGTDITMAKLDERQVLERERQMRARVDGFEQSRRQLEIQARQLRELAESYNEEKIRAEAANQAKSEFLANVSHELRTPLNAIIGFSEMMRDGVLGPIGNPKYEAYVRDINASGRYLLEMINDILDMSKIEAGRMTLVAAVGRASSIFEECLSVVLPGALEGQVESSRPAPRPFLLRRQAGPEAGSD